MFMIPRLNLFVYSPLSVHNVSCLRIGVAFYNGTMEFCFIFISMKNPVPQVWKFYQTCFIESYFLEALVSLRPHCGFNDLNLTRKTGIRFRDYCEFGFVNKIPGLLIYLYFICLTDLEISEVHVMQVCVFFYVF